MPITTCIFDAYGTLFDVTASARHTAASGRFPALEGLWPALAADWRDKQLQYTWLRAVTGAHTDFWAVTQDGLDWALEHHGLGGDADLRAALLDLYWHLQAYPEVRGVLAALKAAGLGTAILSNGSGAMLQGAVDSAGIGDLLDDILSVDSVAVFKPDARVYDLVQARFGGARAEVLFVSANGWDAGCAAAYGFTTAWINRAGAPMDRLPGTPQHVLSDLSPIPELARTA